MALKQERLLERGPVFEASFNHTDQISFAMAMLANDLDVVDFQSNTIFRYICTKASARASYWSRVYWRLPRNG